MDNLHPIELFDKHLFALIKECGLNNKEVVLMINANKDVYKGKFAKAITKQGVELESAYDRVHEERMPFSHIRGSKALMFFLSCQDLTAPKLSSAATTLEWVTTEGHTALASPWSRSSAPRIQVPPQGQAGTSKLRSPELGLSIMVDSNETARDTTCFPR